MNSRAPDLLLQPMFAAALLGTPRLCRWAPDVPSDTEPLFDLERSAFGPSNKLSVSIRVPVHGTLRCALAHEAAHRIERSARLAGLGGSRCEVELPSAVARAAGRSQPSGADGATHDCGRVGNEPERLIES